MRCSASFYPPAEGGRFLEIDAVVEELSRQGVVYGVDFETVRDAVLRCNTERVEMRDIVIAAGTAAVPEIPEHVFIEPHLLKPDSEIDLDALRIDHKERSPFVFVKEGDLLAREWVHPNTCVEVCRASFVVARRMGRVAFQLDKTACREVPVAAR